MTRNQAAAERRLINAARDLELARQTTREVHRAGRATSTDTLRVHDADRAYDAATAACWGLAS